MSTEPKSFLTQLSDALSSIVRTVGEGVVRVEARRGRPASGTYWTDELVVAACHAIDREEGLTLGLPDGTTAAATLVGRDPATDLALLRTDARSQAVPRWSDGADVAPGVYTIALGRPGRTVRASGGLVSAVGESWRTPAGGRIDRYVELDGAIPGGFSGGPIVDGSGGVLGIGSSALVRGPSVVVPTATVRRVVEQLLAHGGIRRGWLGLGTSPVRLPPELRTEAQSSALLVFAVEPDGPAHRAGVLLGDVLLSLDGTPLRDLEELLAFLAEGRAGRVVTARLARAGAPLELALTIGERR